MADVEMDTQSAMEVIATTVSRIEHRVKAHSGPTMNLAAVAHMFIFELASTADDRGGDRRTRRGIFDSIKYGVTTGLYDSQGEEDLPLEESLQGARSH